MKNVFLIFILLSSTFIFSQEKGSILIGAISVNNSGEYVKFEEIKSDLANQFQHSIKKIEYCTNHSLIHIVVDYGIDNSFSSEQIFNYLEERYPNIHFFEKIIHGSFDNLNCKWK